MECDLQAAIRNCTQFEIKLGKDVYFNSGRYQEWPPTTIDPFGIATFTAIHRDFKPEGATGGNTWTLRIEKNIEFDVALVNFICVSRLFRPNDDGFQGFTEPYVGSSKAAIVESTSARAGYDAASESGNAITSKDSWTGEDVEGNAHTIRFDCRSSASRPCRVYEIVQTFY